MNDPTTLRLQWQTLQGTRDPQAMAALAAQTPVDMAGFDGNSLLFDLVRVGWAEAVEALVMLGWAVSIGAHVTGRDVTSGHHGWLGRGPSLLALAVKGGNPDMVRALLKAPLPAEDASFEKNEALYRAVESNQMAMAALLMDRFDQEQAVCGDPDQTKEEIRKLVLPIPHTRAMAELLLQRGFLRSSSRHIIHGLEYQTPTSVLEVLIGANKTGLGDSLNAACFFGRFDVLASLLRAEADPNFLTGQHIGYPSPWAGSNDHSPLAALFFPVNANRGLGSSPEQARILLDAADVLVAHGADLNLRDGSTGKTLFQMVFSHLLDRYPEGRTGEDNGDDWLHPQSDAMAPFPVPELLACLDALVSMGADLQQPADQGQTLFSMALRNNGCNRLEFCQWLHANGASPWMVGENGKDAVETWLTKARFWEKRLAGDRSDVPLFAWLSSLSDAPVGLSRKALDWSMVSNHLDLAGFLTGSSDLAHLPALLAKSASNQRAVFLDWVDRFPDIDEPVDGQHLLTHATAHIDRNNEPDLQVIHKILEKRQEKGRIDNEEESQALGRVVDAYCSHGRAGDEPLLSCLEAAALLLENGADPDTLVPQKNHPDHPIPIASAFGWNEADLRAAALDGEETEMARLRTILRVCLERKRICRVIPEGDHTGFPLKKTGRL